MARLRTLAELRAEVRERADIEGDPHITDAEVNRFVNQSIARLHNLAAIAGEDEFTLSIAIPTVAGTEAYAITGAFYKLVSVDVSVNGQLRPMRRWNFSERALYLNDASWGSISQPLAYRLIEGERISFLPKPDGVYTVTVWYI